MSETRGNKPAWRSELDSHGAMKPEWAEKYLTASLLADWSEYVRHLGEFDWRRDISGELHRSIIAAGMELSSEDLQADIVSILDRMLERGWIDGYPDPAGTLHDMIWQTEGFSDAAHFIEWRDIVAKGAAMRRLLSGVNAIGKAAERCRSVDEIRSMIAQLADYLPPERRRKESTQAESIEEYLKMIEGGQAETIYAGIPEVDESIGGVAPGELVIIGARPSNGKTLMALQWVDAAATAGIASLVLSEEMTRQSLAKRVLTSIVDPEIGDWSANVDVVRSQVRRHFQNRATVIVRESCQTIDVAERVIAQNVRKHDVKIVVVDYAQLLKGAGSNRYEQVSDVSVRMKRVATRHNVTVLLLAQLSRGMETRPDPTPTLADLKDSGQLEQDADVVLFPFWPIKIDRKHADPEEYRIYVGKNRNRATTTPVIEMRIDRHRQRIESPLEQVARDF